MTEEKQYIINLRRAFIRAPSYRKTKRAISEIRNYIIKHMKVSEVKIGKNLNLKMWQHGNKNPPSKIKVKAIIEDNYARVELPEFEFEKKKEKKEKKEVSRGLKGKLEQTMAGLKKDETKKETEDKKKESKAPEAVEVPDQKDKEKQKAKKEQTKERYADPKKQHKEHKVDVRSF